MRVLHIIKTSTGGSWALRQMRELVKLGVEVHAALPPGGPMIPEYMAAGVTVHPVQLDFPVTRPWQFPRVRRAMRTLVTRIAPDLIHSHTVGTTLTMRLALGRQSPPRIFQVPGPLHLEHAFFRRAEIATANPHDYWIATCQFTRRLYYQSGIDTNRVFLSYYGTDVDRYGADTGGTLRAELGVTAQTPIVGMVAYMYAPKKYLGQARGLKGHEDLIDAVALCLESRPELLAVFVGGAWDGATRYENEVREYGRKRCGDHAVFLGNRSDVPYLYPDFDVAVHPSHSENVGGAVESLLGGIPTITTNVGGFPDLIEHETTGWLVQPRAPAELASAILKVLDQPVRAKEIAIAGREKTEYLFDVRRTAREVYDIYQTII